MKIFLWWIFDRKRCRMEGEEHASHPSVSIHTSGKLQRFKCCHWHGKAQMSASVCHCPTTGAHPPHCNVPYRWMGLPPALFAYQAPPSQCTYLLDPGFFQELCSLIELDMCSFHLTLTTLAFLPTLHKFCYKCVSSQAAAPARCPVLHQMVPVILQNSCTACHNQPHYIFSTESGQTSNREDSALKQTVWITPAAGDCRNRLGKH